jgi:membrane fusion protein (multidrug efflux system)
LNTRRLVRFILILLVPAVALVLALRWYAGNERYVSTDNAYVKSDLIAISPAVDGRVVSVAVVDDQRVAAGEELFRIEEDTYRIERDRVRARLNIIVNEVNGLKAQYAQIQAETAEARERLRFLERQLKRQRELATKRMTTEERVDEVASEVTEHRQRIRGFAKRAEQVLARLGGNLDAPPTEHPRYVEASADLQRVELDLSRTIVRSPSNGVVSRMRLQAGEWVKEGDTVFMIVAEDDVWIEANLKETQLTEVREGQSVDVIVDAFPTVTMTGHVASISSATGSEFLLLPPQNATGNWVKVVQRIPVRIRVTDPHQTELLRSGMTATVSIDTETESPLLRFIDNALAMIPGVDLSSDAGHMGRP